MGRFPSILVARPVKIKSSWQVIFLRYLGKITERSMTNRNFVMLPLAGCNEILFPLA